MRIGIDIRELKRGKRTGMGRYLLNFLDYIDQNDKEKEYVLFTNGDTNFPKLRPDIKIKVIPEFFTIYWDQKVLAKQIQEEKIDVFYSPTYKGPMNSSAKLVVTCHDLHFLNFQSRAIRDSLRRRYCRKILQSADTIITVSEYSKQTIQDFLGKTTPRIVVVYDSVTDKFRPLDKRESFDKVHQSFALKEDFVLYVGALKPKKNLIRLIWGYSLLPESLNQQHQLVIVGNKDNNYPKLRNFARKRNVRDNVKFLGLVEDEELINLYNASRVLTLVSLDEGFGLPALEAMACGAPVLVSNTTSLPEVVNNAGILVDPYNVGDISDSLKRLLTDEVLRAELSRKGLLRAKNFSVENMAEKILKIFKELG